MRRHGLWEQHGESVKPWVRVLDDFLEGATVDECVGHFSGEGLLSMAFAEAEWAVAPSIDIVHSTAYGFLNPLFLAPVFELGARRQILVDSRVFSSSGWKLGQRDCGGTVRILQAQAAAKDVWQLEQPATSPAWNFPEVRRLGVNDCCSTRDMCFDGCTLPASFPTMIVFSNCMHFVRAAMNTLMYTVYRHVNLRCLHILGKTRLFHRVGVVICEMCFLS